MGLEKKIEWVFFCGEEKKIRRKTVKEMGV